MERVSLKECGMPARLLGRSKRDVEVAGAETVDCRWQVVHP